MADLGWLGDLTAADEAKAASDNKDEERQELRTMDKVIIASVVVSALGVMVQIWSLSRQAKKELAR